MKQHRLSTLCSNSQLCVFTRHPRSVRYVICRGVTTSDMLHDTSTHCNHDCVTMHLHCHISYSSHSVVTHAVTGKVGTLNRGSIQEYLSHMVSLYSHHWLVEETFDWYTNVLMLLLLNASQKKLCLLSILA